MKKIFALILTLVTVFTLSTTAFAAASKITAEEAKNAALAHAGFTADEVRFTKTELDFDDGRYEYEIEFFVNGVEYEYTVAASDGKILEFDIEGQKLTAPAGSITEAQAIEIALKNAGFSESDTAYIKSELDFDNGRYEYEIEFVVNGVEYEYTVAAADGKILKVEKEVEDFNFSLSFLLDFFRALFAAIFG